MQTTLQKKRKMLSPVQQAQSGVRKDLAAAAGSQQFEFRDPTYHVSESFQQTFDRIGQKRASALSGEWEAYQNRQEEPQRGQEAQQGRREPAYGQGERDAGDRRENIRKGPLPDSRIPVDQFSQVAFQRGDLAMSVIEGTGKMVLTSCLKRTIGQSGPKREQQKSISQIGSQRRNVPGHSPDQMVFNRTFAQSAVGLVVDTLRDARRVTESMADMAQGTGELEAGAGGSTLRTMYPFLDDSQERGLLVKYQQQLAQCQDPRERPILQNALVHTRGLLNKKAQMKVEFINHLRQITEKATEALAEFEAPGFVDTLLEELFPDEEEPPEDPEDPKDPKGDGHGGQPVHTEERDYQEGPAPAEDPPSGADGT